MTEKRRSYYINGTGVLSPQKTFNNNEFLPEIITYDQNVLTSVLPDFKEYLTPMQLRRLNRMLRIGVTAAMICIRDSGRTTMDGIITATGYGFLNDTAVFLNEVLDQKEQHVAPTHFMQSTYNALSGLAALSIQCKGYNSTYVSKGFAFENALHDALMQISENPLQNFLVGSYDEADITQYNTHTRTGYFKSEKISTANLFESKTGGTIQGEGSAFFCISGEPSSTTWCSIQDVETIYKPDQPELTEAISRLLQSNGLTPGEIDLLISGIGGDHQRDSLLKRVTESTFAETPRLYFKQLCGDYCTASSFAVWLGASVLKKQAIPAIVINPGVARSSLEWILIVNHYLDSNYSLILLRRSVP